MLVAVELIRCGGIFVTSYVVLVENLIRKV